MSFRITPLPEDTHIATTAKYNIEGHEFSDRDIERLYNKFQLRSDGCWEWTAGLNVPYPEGYGRFWLGKIGLLAHRVIYQWLRGPIPDGLQLDHTCRNRQCVNPDHLEPVTRRENILRGEGYTAQLARRTHCKHGHLLDGDNLKAAQEGTRLCRECARERSRNWWRKTKGKGLEAYG